MKTPCEVIRDLLPLYAEKMTSGASDALIEEHLSGCKECAALLETMRTKEKEPPVMVGAGASLAAVRRNIKTRKSRACAFVSLLVFLLVFTLFSYFTKPIYVPYQDSGIRVWETSEQELYVSFSDSVTACRVLAGRSEDGKTIREVEAWSTVWDRILGNATPAVLLAPAGEKTDTVYYCDYTREQDNMTVLYGEAAGGAAVLPRLFPVVYFLAAAVLSLVTGLLWLLLRKRRPAASICRCLFFAPVSYLVACMLLSTPAASFGATRDFVMNVIAAAVIYSLCLLGGALLRQRREDRTL